MADLKTSTSWTCPSCTLKNPPFAPICGACRSLNVSPMPTFPSSSLSRQEVVKSASGSPYGDIEFRPWACRKCTLVNSSSKSACEACGEISNASRKRKRGSEAALSEANPETNCGKGWNWTCSRCTMQNVLESGACGACGAKKGEGGRPRVVEDEASILLARALEKKKGGYVARGPSVAVSSDRASIDLARALEEQERRYRENRRLAAKIAASGSGSGLVTGRERGEVKLPNEIEKLKAELASQQVAESKGLCVTGILDILISKYKALPSKRAQNVRLRLADPSVAGICLAGATDRVGDTHLCERETWSPVKFFFSNPGQLEAGAGWACGWRNLQMLSAAIIHRERFERGGSAIGKMKVFGGSGFVPGVSYLQRWLEIAWEQGFDPVGAAHLKPVYGTTKWIGTTECATLIRSFGVRAEIVNFIDEAAQFREKQKKSESRAKGVKRGGPSGKNDSRKSVRRVPQASHDRLVEWVWDYFKPETPLNPWSASKSSSLSSFQAFGTIQTSKKLPLYFQHQGHSRTIVGIERKSGTAGGPPKATLIVLDPAHDGWQLKDALERDKGWQSKLKRGLHTLRRAEYQIVHVSEVSGSIFMSKDELERSKHPSASKEFRHS